MGKTVNPARKIAARLRSEILAGEWADRPLPSERALSASCRVARLTARKGLQQLCAEHLLESRPGLGYILAPGVTGLGRRPQDRAVFFFFVDSTGQMALDPLDVAIMNGASGEARRQGLELFATCQEPAVFRRIVEERKGKDLRGILLDWARRDVAEFLLESGVPFVVVEDDIEGLPIIAVIQDNARGTGLALEHIVERGHRRIGLIVNSEKSVHPAQRLAAYREFMLRSELGVKPELIAQDGSGLADGRRAAASLLDLPERPTAIYVASRGMLDGVIAELAGRGLKFPQDISLAVWGAPGSGEPTGEVNDVSFVTWDRQELGRMAMLALQERVRIGRPERMVFRIEPRLMDRGSVASPCTGHLEGN